MSFKEIVGQETAIKILQNSLKERRRGISYLFYGPDGVGKSFTAKQFAKGLNCQEDALDSCEQCPSCLKSDKLKYPDLHWLGLKEDSQSIGIERIRQMQSAVNLKPFEGRVKVFVINNAQALSEEAANCLLKVIEEPPADSVIILITTRLRAVLPTISSRCQKIKFSNLSRMQVEGILKRDYSLDAQQSGYLARYCDGKIAEAGLLSSGDFLARRKGILDTFSRGEEFSPRGGLEAFFKDKAQAVQGLSILMSYFRDVLFVKAGMPDEYLINQDRFQEVMSASRMYTHSELLSLLAKLSKSFEYLDQNINLRLLTDNIWTAGRRIWKK
jgi:DNA polymerase-3 subunit delta'